MQGWDSVEIRSDVELGGTEQLFSLLVARSLQQSRGQSPQIALTMPILVGTDGVRRMGKSLGNDIGIGLPPDALFGKLMSVPDEPLRQYFTLLTDLPLAEIDTWLAPGVNPRDAKESLARSIVAGLTSREDAEAAAAEFRRRTHGEDPDEIPSKPVPRDQLDSSGRLSAPRLIVALGLEKSTSDARRVIEGGGVTIGAERTTVTDPKTLIDVRDGLVVRVGKTGRKIARVVLS